MQNQVRSSRRDERGFTLVELVVVVVVLGILAAVAIPKLFSITAEAEKAAVATMIGSLESTLGMYTSKQFVQGNSIVRHNPFDDLSNIPTNYNGAMATVNATNTPDKTWSYRNDGWIMYNPSQNITGGWLNGGERFIIYRVDAVVDGTDTVGLYLNVASYAYTW